MDGVDYIAWAIPVFIVTVGLEAFWGEVTGRPVYRFSDTLANLGCGIASSVVDLFLKLFFFQGYLIVYDRFRAFSLGETPWLAWTVAFFGYDLLYYWWHRSAHRVGFIWAAHVVHHQSQEYNLSVALRQAMFGVTTSWLYYLPLAFLGVPPGVFLTMGAISLLYQFWIHTRSVRSLGALEAILNSPGHHRVHHGINPKYIDKNYAAILIVWDRMFGTFQPEEEEPVYGTVTPFQSWNPIWANFEFWAFLWGHSRAQRNWKNKLLVFLKPPGWSPERGEYPVPEVDARTFQKWDTRVPGKVRWYLTLQLIPLVAGTMAIMVFSEKTGPLLWWPLAVVLLFSLWVSSLFAEGKSFALPAEVVRIAAEVILVFAWLK